MNSKRKQSRRAPRRLGDRRPGTSEGQIKHPPLPMTRAEMEQRGWDEVDIVFVSGDAYVDHPAFAAGILGRVLEANGFRVGILAQPDWHSCEAWKTFGRPKLFFAISAGNMDSMLNHYTANKKVRNDDAYSPGGQIGMRPDRATRAYCQRAREAYKGIPILAGGVEASLRRLAHYDYWSDTVKRSILLDAKADLILFGMGEESIVEAARSLQAGQTVKDLRDMLGVAYACGAGESAPEGDDVVVLPSYDEVKNDKVAFAEATRRIHLETNPYNARTLVQYHDRQAVVCNPPRLPVTQSQMDSYYDLPYTRRPHPIYKSRIPAYEVVKDSITIMRGCFGGCTFCSITLHQGRIIQSRSEESVVREIKSLAHDKQFKGTISDIGGPTANMYKMHCSSADAQRKCRRLSCVHPTICKLLKTDHKPLLRVMRQARSQEGIKRVFVASGVRTDLAQISGEYIRELVAHHVGGHLKVAPEHTDAKTLDLMKKPPIEDFQRFAEEFYKATKACGKEQFLVPYFIASHPGSTVDAMIDLALYLNENGYRPDQVQDFIPAPLDVATCMYYTGLDPANKQPVYVAQHLRDRKLQRALMQYFKPENYQLVKKILIEAGRTNLIGTTDQSLISPIPPRGGHVAKVERSRNPRETHRKQEESGGYRPSRRSAQRRNRRSQSHRRKADD